MEIELNNSRKIIHVDMDCFYAAIEIRDNPILQNKPVAVGGSVVERSVLCTCNYIARKYGVRSAMPTSLAIRKCPDLIVLPVTMEKYKNVSRETQKIFYQFTDLVEPLALDEAFLDVTGSLSFSGSATLIANEIRRQIWDSQHLTASAGVAPNKFLAKVASKWNKPNGIFVIKPDEIDGFIKSLTVDNLFGVGKVSSAKLHAMGIKTCAELQRISLNQLIQVFGSFGVSLYQQCRGIDNRPVNNQQKRKSLSVETTFSHDIIDINECLLVIDELFVKLDKRLEPYKNKLKIKNIFVKIKLGNFKQSTTETRCNSIDLVKYKNMLLNLVDRKEIALRLIGLGVTFVDNDGELSQPSLFDDED